MFKMYFNVFVKDVTQVAAEALIHYQKSDQSGDLESKPAPSSSQGIAAPVPQGL